MQVECNTEIKMNVPCSTKNFFPLDINHNMVFEIADLFQEKVTRSFGLVFFFLSLGDRRVVHMVLLGRRNKKASTQVL